MNMNLVGVAPGEQVQCQRGPFRSEEPTTKGSSAKRRHGQMRTLADGGERDKRVCG